MTFLGHFKKTKGCHYALSSNFQSHKYQTTDFFHMFDHLYVYYAKVWDLLHWLYIQIYWFYIYNKLNNSQSKYWVLPYTALLFLTSIFNSIIWKIERYVSYNIKSSLFTFPFLYYYYHPLFLQNILASWKINYLDTPNNVSGSKRESSLIYT